MTSPSSNTQGQRPGSSYARLFSLASGSAQPQVQGQRPGSYQPGAKPQETTQPQHRALKARLITASLTLIASLASTLPSTAQLRPHLHHAQVHATPPATVTGQHIYDLTKQYLAVAPKRFITSPGHDAAENFIKQHFQPEMAHGQFVTDPFYPTTPIGQIPMRNYIVKYPGKKDGIIVLASHYETNYPLKDIGFVGANDGACTTALLIAIGEYYRTHPNDGYGIWLVFDDGEEAVREWSASDSLYGTRHLAAKWSGDGTLAHIKAFLLADMIGDKDLNILDETQSTPWLRETLKRAAAETHHTAALGKTSGAEEDDHLPFLMRGVPSIDIIDTDYGPHTKQLPDGYHHTAQDTIDKISVKSLQTSADLFMAMIKLINQR